MLKALGKWFDSLWEGNPHHPDNKSPLAEKVIEVQEPRRRHFGPDHAFDGIKHYLGKRYDRVVCLTRTYIGTNYVVVDNEVIEKEEEKVEHSYYFQTRNGYINRITNISTPTGFTSMDTKLIKDDTDIYLKKGDKLSWSVLEHGSTLPRVMIDKLKKLKAKPHTYANFTGGLHLVDIGGDNDVTFITDKGDRRVVRELFLDLYVHHNKINVADLKPTKTTAIADYNKVDRRLIPQNDFRRWVVINELEDALSPWTLRYVPRDSARGAIRYFRLEVNFDAGDLGGTSFDIPRMLVRAIDRITKECDDELLFKVENNGYYTPEDSDVFVNIDNLRIRHEDLDLGIKQYVEMQENKKEFHDANPYLSPYAPDATYKKNVFGFNDDNTFYHYNKYETPEGTEIYGRTKPATKEER